jgi:hypothetical protein
VAENVPAPPCSLASGALPSTPPCSDPEVGFADAGVDQLVDEMERRGTYFYATSAHPQGIVGHDDVVVVKVNDQWAAYGDGSGHGRLTTSTDGQGLIWSILQHPDGSPARWWHDNTQYNIADWNVTQPAEDQQRRSQDVVSAFQGRSYQCPSLDLGLLERQPPHRRHGWRWLPAWRVRQRQRPERLRAAGGPGRWGTDRLSYPKFQTEAGTGEHALQVRDGSSYAADRLTLVNLPVLSGTAWRSPRSAGRT